MWLVPPEGSGVGVEDIVTARNPAYFSIPEPPRKVTPLSLLLFDGLHDQNTFFFVFNRNHFLNWIDYSSIMAIFTLIPPIAKG